MRILLMSLALLITGLISTPVLAESTDNLERYREGLYHLLGNHGYSKNPIKAAQIFTDLADQNVAAAQHMLGTQYEAGNGVEQDVIKAFNLYQSAADQGFFAAQRHLARLKKTMTQQQLDQAQGS